MEDPTTASGVSFQVPAGWDHLKCESAVYPDFEQEPCNCLGDPQVLNETWFCFVSS